MITITFEGFGMGVLSGIIASALFAILVTLLRLIWSKIREHLKIVNVYRKSKIDYI